MSNPLYFSRDDFEAGMAHEKNRGCGLERSNETILCLLSVTCGRHMDSYLAMRSTCCSPPVLAVATNTYDITGQHSGQLLDPFKEALPLILKKPERKSVSALNAGLPISWQ
jgi:hypothetical protein